MGPGYTPVVLPDGEDYLFLPVSRGWCKFESLIDGSLSLADVATMNDAIAVFDENAARAQRAANEVADRG